MYDPRFIRVICGKFLPLPCRFIQQDRCSDTCIQRLDARRVRDRHQLIGQRKNLLWDTCAFIADDDHRRASEISFMKGLAFV